MKKKLVCLGVVLIMVFSMCACGRGTKIWFSAGAGFTGEELIGPDLTELVKSAEELQQVCDKYGFNNKNPAFNEEYFSEKAFILHSYTEYRISYSRQIDSVRIADGILFVYIIHAVPRWGILMAIDYSYYSTYLIEVNQEDIKNITEIQVIREEKKVGKSPNT